MTMCATANVLAFLLLVALPVCLWRPPQVCHLVEATAGCLCAVEATAGPPRVWMGPATRPGCCGSAGSALGPHCRCCKQLCCQHSCAAAAGHTAAAATSCAADTAVLLPQVVCGPWVVWQVQRCHPTVHAATGTGSRQGVARKPQPAAGLRCPSTPTCCCRAPVPADTPVLPHSPQVLFGQRPVFLSTAGAASLRATLL